MNNKFGSNIGGHMKEQSWKSQACGFIKFEVVFVKPQWKAIRPHISATKGL